MELFEAGKITEASSIKIAELITLLEKNGFNEKGEGLKNALSKLSEEEKIKVAFVGQYSAGKSSIISAVTGDQQIEIGSDVTTQDVAFYQWGNFLLADTPGLHDNETHDEIANEAIKNSDLIIYCITSELFNKNTLADYIDLVYNKGYASKIILVINKLNSEATSDRAQLIENYISSINDALSPHSISDVKYAFFDVKDYIKGVSANNERRIEHSNFESFITLLNSFLEEKGLLLKLTTPLYEAKDIIDSTFIDCSENEVDLARRNTLAKLTRIVNRLRNRAAYEWDKIIQDEYIDFLGTAYSYVDRISEENFDFDVMFDKLCDDTNQNIIEALEKLISDCEDSLSLETSSVFESTQAQYYIKNAPENELENSRVFEGPKHKSSSDKKIGFESIKSGLESSNLSDIPTISKEAGENIIRGGRDAIQKISKKLGKEIKIKFKPHGIKKAGEKLAKVSEKLAKACKYAGPVMDAIAIGVDIWSTYNENKEAKEYMNSLLEMRHEIDKYKIAQVKEWKKEKDAFLEEVYTAIIGKIENEKKSILDNKEKANEFNGALSELMLDFENLIQSVLMTGK